MITTTAPVVAAGGGIGGLAAALALVRQGFDVTVLEQAAEICEIGAGIQLGPNPFTAFDALGVGDKARSRAVYTDELVMHPWSPAYPWGAFRNRFGRPYASARRAAARAAAAQNARHALEPCRSAAAADAGR